MEFLCIFIFYLGSGLPITMYGLPKVFLNFYCLCKPEASLWWFGFYLLLYIIML